MASSGLTPSQRWQSAENPASLPPFENSPTVKLLALPSQRAISIHSAILTAVSPFFRAALSSTYGFQESKTSEVVLEVEDPETLDLFAKWAYAWAKATGNGEQRPVAGKQGRNQDSFILDEIDDPRKDFRPIFRLYIFADKYCVLILKDQACARVREIARKIVGVPKHDDVELLWENTTTGNSAVEKDHMRQTVFDLYCALDPNSLDCWCLLQRPCWKRMADEGVTGSSCQFWSDFLVEIRRELIMKEDPIVKERRAKERRKST